uniref:Tail fiber protein n=1 Tax=Myoviridae sp. ctPkm1 TaxID=2825099 RepID=A0A8S5TY90_9CAUD|nr:MAG TPA: Tail fiber protein [Myoviridae sp. ctPkm1]
MDKSQTEYLAWRAALKGNYRKGVHALRGILASPSQSALFAKSAPAVSLVVDFDASNADGNAAELYKLLCASGIPGECAATYVGSESVAAMAADASAMSALARSCDNAKGLLAASSTAMQAVAASDAALVALWSEPEAVAFLKTKDAAWKAFANPKDPALARAVAKLAGLDPSGYSTIQAVAASSTAMQAVAASSTAMQAVIASSTAMQAVAASSTAMQAVAKKAAVASMKAFLVSLNKEQTLVTAAYKALQDTKAFEKGTAKSQDGVSALDSLCKTANSFVACYLGSYGGSSSQLTNLFYDGTQIASHWSSSKPTSVSESTCNAIGFTNCTFTETGDGQAAIVVYTAI